MTAQRKLIRHAIKSQLDAWAYFQALPMTFQLARTHAVNSDVLPVGLIYTDKDQSSGMVDLGKGSSYPAPEDRQDLRRLQLVVIVYVGKQDDSDTEDLLDDMGEQVERGVLSDTLSGGNSLEIEFAASDSVRSANGEVIVGSLMLVFNVTYMRSVPVDGA